VGWTRATGKSSSSRALLELTRSNDLKHRHLLGYKWCKIHTHTLKETILKVVANLIVPVIRVGISKGIIGHLLSLDLFLLILLFGLLCLSLTLSFGKLNLFVLDDIARLDDISNGIIVQEVLALLDDLFQKDSRQLNLSVCLWYLK
jgi:hypothetical protein